MREYKVWMIWRHMKKCLLLEGSSQDQVLLCLKMLFPGCRIISVTPLEVPIH